LIALTESLIAFWYCWSVSLPDEMSKTIGFAPFCWGGNFSSSRSLASWLPVPGSERSLLVSEPILATAPKTITSMTTQAPMTTSGLRAASMPSLWSSRATVNLPQPRRRLTPLREGRTARGSLSRCAAASQGGPGL